jgi:formyltetrahydrofolate-dependent phosphoribosylglycinamide formyltransferase
MIKAKLMVMISGNGTNLQAIIDACEAESLPAEIVGVISNRNNAYGLYRAEKHNIPTVIFYPIANRAEYDADLASLVDAFKPDWIVLAGWMRILSMNFLGKYPNKVVNLHPALPGQFPGTHAIERAFEAFQRGEIKQTGVMVHLVPDEGVDNGPVLASQAIPITTHDTLETLTERVHKIEHQILVDTLRQLILGIAIK